MSNELTAAAERWRKTGPGVYPEPMGDGKEIPNALDDSIELADFAAKLLDPTPVDEAFIQSLGWAGIEGRDTWRTYVSPKSMRPGPVVHITWEPMLGCDGWFVGGELVPTIETRGQLRMLCGALGIPCEEKQCRT